MQKEHWFEHWFDSPYYHILYQNRNNQEAKANIDQLLLHLNLAGGAAILDLACGQGRHAHHIFQKGFQVTGYDLSPNNIAIAQKNALDGLVFEVRDMREHLGTSKFDAIFNLFTSFGYFETREAHLTCLQQVYKALKPGGIFVLDFLNAKKIACGLVPEEIVTASGITFHIKRKKEGNQLVKEISFEVGGVCKQFAERVMAFNAADFLDLFTQVGFHITNRLGSFDGEPFQPAQSDRLILIASK